MWQADPRPPCTVYHCTLNTASNSRTPASNWQNTSSPKYNNNTSLLIYEYLVSAFIPFTVFVKFSSVFFIYHLLFHYLLTQLCHLFITTEVYCQISLLSYLLPSYSFPVCVISSEVLAPDTPSSSCLSVPEWLIFLLCVFLSWLLMLCEFFLLDN
jgi:hypothetical protein